ncbi:hypothetical protein PO909_021611, partial [Leuciscus waleckii]
QVSLLSPDSPPALSTSTPELCHRQLLRLARCLHVHGSPSGRPPHVYFHCKPLGACVFPSASHLATPGVETFHLRLDTPVILHMQPLGVICVFQAPPPPPSGWA